MKFKKLLTTLTLLMTLGMSIPSIADDKSAEFQKTLALAKTGDLIAQFNLGVMYNIGQGTNQDYSQARYWYQKAANQGMARAQSNLGVLYAEGKGVKQDYIQAIYWYQKAANQGHAISQYNLGMRYLKGQGVKQDINVARKYFSESCDNGLKLGCDVYLVIAKTLIQFKNKSV